MGQVLHGCARTTEAVRRSLQRSQESMTALASRHGVNRKTIAKWKKRAFVHDAAMGPKQPRSTSLTPEEEATVVAFRQHTFLPLGDCLYALQPTILHLSARPCTAPAASQDQPLGRREGRGHEEGAFKKYPIGYFHLDIAEVRTEEGRLYLFVAIDWTSKLAYAELHKSQRRGIAVGFLVRLIKRVPYRIHTVLTDNGIQFTHRKRDRYAFTHLFDRMCYMNGIEHLKTFLLAYNYAKRLKTLRGLTPYEFICQEWVRAPHLFLEDPVHHTPGPRRFFLSLSPAEAATVEQIAEGWKLLGLCAPCVTPPENN